MDKLLELMIYAQGPVPYILAFAVLFACGLGLPIPEDITLFAMGLVSYYGLADVRISIAVCLAGVLIGDSMIYWIGFHYGSRLAQKGIFKRLLPPDRMQETRKLFHKWGNKVIFAARFMPGLRAPAYFSAGTLHLPYRVFFFYDGVASLLSVPLLVGLTYRFGDQVDKVIQIAHRVQNGIFLVIAAVILIFVLKHMFMKRRASRSRVN